MADAEWRKLAHAWRIERATPRSQALWGLRNFGTMTTYDLARTLGVSLECLKQFEAEGIIESAMSPDGKTQWWRLMPMNKEFEVHMLNDAGKAKAAAIAEAFDLLLHTLEQICPATREMSITRTKLEEACFFAKKAMANVKDNQQP